MAYAATVDVAIGAYSDEVTLIQPWEQANKLQPIPKLTAGGGTHTAGALVAALDYVERRLRYYDEYQPQPIPKAIKAYAPIVRLVFQQHVSQLTRNFTARMGEPPVTAGREYRDDIIVVARGEHPARLAKLTYHEDPILNAQTKVPPPHVPAIATRSAISNAVGGGQQQPAASGGQPSSAAPAPAAFPTGAAPRVQRRGDPVVRPRQK